MKTPHVQEFCNQLWDRREKADFQQSEAGELSRGLIEATFADVREHPSYLPGADGRFTWALAVLDRIRGGDLRARASGDLEAMAAFLLERRQATAPSGKELAAADH